MKASSTTSSTMPKSEKLMVTGNSKVRVSSVCLLFILINNEWVEEVVRCYESKIHGPIWILISKACTASIEGRQTYSFKRCRSVGKFAPKARLNVL
jgi:hypothetical protein